MGKTTGHIYPPIPQSPKIDTSRNNADSYIKSEAHESHFPNLTPSLSLLCCCPLAYSTMPANCAVSRTGFLTFWSDHQFRIFFRENISAIIIIAPAHSPQLRIYGNISEHMPHMNSGTYDVTHRHSFYKR